MNSFEQGPFWLVDPANGGSWQKAVEPGCMAVLQVDLKLEQKHSQASEHAAVSERVL